MSTHSMNHCVRKFTALVAAQIWIAAGCAAGQSDPPQVPPNSAAGQSAAKPNPVVLKLQRAFQDCDEEILRTTNSLVYTSGAPREVMRVLVSAWGPSNESSTCVHNLRIRAFIAEALAQGRANGIVERVDVPSIRVALRAGVQSTDPETASASVFGLVAIAEPEDFRRLEALARNKLSIAREEVVHALAIQCLDEPSAILRRLEGEFDEGYVDRIRHEMAQVREANCKRDSPD